ANAPASTDGSVSFGFYNDFLGRGGRNDDFRTQQLILTGRFAERWYLTVDHSVLTVTDPSDPGRVDQLSATLGYALIDRRADAVRQRVLVGTGVRAHGDFAGERMQNGFHQLFGIDLEFLPYRPGESDSAVAWIDAQHQWVRSGQGRIRPGLWLRGSLLATTDGQLDASFGAYGMLEHARFDLWAGLRSDWREGYDSLVVGSTARAESDTAAVLGFAWGPLLVETVQQFDNDASYGSIRLVSSPPSFASSSGGASRYAVDLGFLLPDVRLSVDGRITPGALNSSGRAWTTSVLLRAASGQPQIDGDSSLYVDSSELTAGLEVARPVRIGSERVEFYASVGLGARAESLFGEGERQGQESGSVTSAVLALGAGMRTHLADLGDGWWLGLRLGGGVSLPLSDRSVDLGPARQTLPESRFALEVAVVLQRF
ncbi:MAG: hypothetical protein AAFX10_10110, partial [Pseudomonadota bacterium]